MIGNKGSTSTTRYVESVIYSGSTTIPADYFGVSMWQTPIYRPDDTYVLPAVNYSFTRLCDIDNPAQPLGWHSINTSLDTYNWTRLDIDVAYHVARGTPIWLYAGTYCPTWASARPSEVNTPPIAGAGNPNEPANMLHWKKWLEAVATRYDNQITHYVMPNEPKFSTYSASTTNYFTGTAAKYAEMTRIASQVVKSINANNKVVGPEIANIGNQVTHLSAMLGASAEGYDAGFGTGAGTFGRDWLDYIGVHPYYGEFTEVKHAYGVIPEWPTLLTAISAAGAGGIPLVVSELMSFIGTQQAPQYVGDRTYLIRHALIAACLGGVSKFNWFSIDWSGSAFWLSNNEGTQARIFWPQMRDICIGSAITQLAIMSDRSLRVTRADGKVYFV